MADGCHALTVHTLPIPTNLLITLVMAARNAPSPLTLPLTLDAEAQC